MAGLRPTARALPLYPWDESRLDDNALEMTRNGNWLVTYYEGAPDLWSPKPPLMIWLMALSIEVFGPVESARTGPVIAVFRVRVRLTEWFLLKLR